MVWGTYNYLQHFFHVCFIVFVVSDLADDTIEHLEGNLTRDLWKLSCWEFSRAVSLLTDVFVRVYTLVVLFVCLFYMCDSGWL